jgi:hypothetical protein
VNGDTGATTALLWLTVRQLCAGDGGRGTTVPRKERDPNSYTLTSSPKTSNSVLQEVRGQTGNDKFMWF